MKNWWIRFGCFLTGYNYEIVSDCSQITAKRIKQYLSAMLIIATLWGFIGYNFTEHYLHGKTLSCIVGVLLMIFIIIQIERIIILFINKSKSAFILRMILGILMACIGSVIVDQILFMDDIKLVKIEDIDRRVNEYLPIKTKEIDDQIQKIDNEISKKEVEENSIGKDITKRPTILVSDVTNKQEKDSIGHTRLSKEINTRSVPNPNIERLSRIDEQINKMREQKIEKENKKLTMQEDLKKQFEKAGGLLDELRYFFKIMFSSGITIGVGFLFISFFLVIELLVLAIKWTTNDDDDYNKTIIRQMEARIQRIKNLE